MPNSALERSDEQRGRAVLAMESVLGGAELASWSVAQLGRWAVRRPTHVRSTHV